MAVEDAILTAACLIMMLSMMAWASLVARSMAQAWQRSSATLVAESLRMYLDAVAAGELDEAQVCVHGATIIVREGSLIICSGHVAIVVELPAGLEVRHVGDLIVIRRRCP